MLSFFEISILLYLSYLVHPLPVNPSEGDIFFDCPAQDALVKPTPLVVTKNSDVEEKKTIPALVNRKEETQPQTAPNEEPLLASEIEEKKLITQESTKKHGAPKSADTSSGEFASQEATHQEKAQSQSMETPVDKKTTTTTRCPSLQLSNDRPSIWHLIWRHFFPNTPPSAAVLIVLNGFFAGVNNYPEIWIAEIVRQIKGSLHARIFPGVDGTIPVEQAPIWRETGILIRRIQQIFSEAVDDFEKMRNRPGNLPPQTDLVDEIPNRQAKSEADSKISSTQRDPGSAPPSENPISASKSSMQENEHVALEEVKKMETQYQESTGGKQKKGSKRSRETEGISPKEESRKKANGQGHEKPKLEQASSASNKDAMGGVFRATRSGQNMKNSGQVNQDV